MSRGVNRGWLRAAWSPGAPIPATTRRQVDRPADGSARRPAVRRRDAAPVERWAVLVVAVLGGVAAVLWSDAAPTTVPVLDALERFAVAFGVAAAGSRSRRWTLVLATTLVAAGCAGAARWLGIAALVATIALVETRVRSRVVGAAIGAVVGVLVQRMQVPGPTGLELVVAAAAVAPVLVSGYRRSRPRSQMRIRRTALVAVVGLALFAAVGLVAALFAAPAAIRAAEHSNSAVAAVQRGDGGAASTSLRAASGEFETADALLGAWWASGAQLLPGVGANVAAVRDAAAIGAELADGASVLLADIEFDGLRSQDGGVDLTEMAAIAPRLQEAARQVDRAGASFRGIDSPWLLPPVAQNVARMERELERLGRDAHRVDLAFTHLPDLVGGSTSRRYLVLLGNPAEARDLGGHIGNWVELEATAGDVRLTRVGGPLELAIADVATTRATAEGLPPSLRAMQPLRYPQNLSGTPDLPTVAQTAADLVRLQDGRVIDGVLYADVEAFAAFLSLVGPVDVPGAQPPVQLSPENAVEFLTVGQFQSFPDDDAAGAALEEVIRVVFDRLTASRLGSPQQLAELFSPLVSEGRFQFASLHRGDAAFLDELDLQGQLPAPAAHTEVLGVLNRNVGPSKIDAFLTKEITADFVWDEVRSEVDGVVHVELHNAAPSTGLSRTVIGNAAGAPDGSNVTDLTVLTPHPADAVLVDGLARPAQPLQEGPLWRHTVRVTVPPGGTVTVDVHLTSQRRPPGPFRLAWVGQPGVGQDTAEVRVDRGQGRQSSAAFDAAGDSKMRLSAGGVDR